MLTIDIDMARRFILGKQGLWPWRRWQGIEGTKHANRRPGRATAGSHPGAA